MSYKYCNVKLAETDGFLFENIRIPINFYTKAKGLLGTCSTSHDVYMLFESCNSIHMFGMRIPLDIVFLSSENTILKYVENLKPWRFAFCYRSTKTLELPAGTIKKYSLENNMKLEIEKCIQP